MSAPRVVAIDGPAGSGKSTAARLVSQRLGLVHIDTGSTYRLVALEALRGGVRLDDADAAAELARRVAGECSLGPGGVLKYRGTPVGAEIRTADVSRAASVVAAHPRVREAMVALQRRLVPAEGAVIEGRDIGTVVWPEAPLKVYLEAREDVRARRRSEHGGGTDAVEAVRERDSRDAGRPVGAMRPALDAVVIDTTETRPEEVADTILAQLPPPQAPNLLYRMVRDTLRFLLLRVFSLRIEGPNRIPAHGAAILAPNHRSLIDIPAVAALTRRKVWFMGKEELFRSSLMHRIWTALGGFPVRRGKPDRRALNVALDLLRRGELVAVYPEGTRTPDARFEHIEDGFAYLALKSGAPIVPIALSGTEAVFPKGRRLPRRVRIRVAIGEPFTLPTTDGAVGRSRVRAATDQARRHLTAAIDRLERRPAS